MQSSISSSVLIPVEMINVSNLSLAYLHSSESVINAEGMSTEEEIEDCMRACNPDVVMHTNSTYPAPVEELNLNYINWLRAKWGWNKEIGYSGHEYGLATTFATVAMGCTWIERHTTLDRRMWGSDQKASVEPQGLIKLCQGIRNIEKAMGSGGSRICLGGEKAKRESLRK